ncbi:hypothetical protein DFS34DRAFT_659714 [Phlyctochytrium arcticum]|nr:hypothetical protein DFS34DRAFT_659714 [Phlyctochytrium arcticum]
MELLLTLSACQRSATHDFLAFLARHGPAGGLRRGHSPHSRRPPLMVVTVRSILVKNAAHCDKPQPFKCGMPGCVASFPSKQIPDTHVQYCHKGLDKGAGRSSTQPGDSVERDPLRPTASVMVTSAKRCELATAHLSVQQVPIFVRGERSMVEHPASAHPAVGAAAPTHPCEETTCTLTYPTAAQARRHYLNVHVNNRPCTKCGRTMSSSSNTKTHEKKCRGS